VALVLCWRRRRWLAGVAASGMAVGLGVFAWVNEHAYGDWLPLYYRSRLSLDRTAAEAFAANLVSPARGLFVWSPVLLVGVVWCVRHLREVRVLDRLLLVWVVAHLVAMALFEHWWAGASVGPRFMLDVVPALVVLSAPVVTAVASDPRWRRPLAMVLVATIGWAGFVNVRAAQEISVVEWNFPSAHRRSVDEDPSRVWDWRDPQFLA